MCENIKTTFRGILHLVVRESTMLSVSSCSCYINVLNRTSLSIKINDIRLQRKREAACSDSVIFINTKEIACDNYKSDNNTIFQQLVGNKGESYARIMIKSTVAPRMVWLSAEAKGNSLHYCIKCSQM